MSRPQFESMKMIEIWPYLMSDYIYVDTTVINTLEKLREFAISKYEDNNTYKGVV